MVKKSVPSAKRVGPGTLKEAAGNAEHTPGIDVSQGGAEKNEQPAAEDIGATGAVMMQSEHGSLGEISGDRRSIPGLEVSSTRDGYRRAGFAWTKAPITITGFDLTETQFNQIIEDQELTVRFVDVVVGE